MKRLLAILLLALAGCASLGLEAPKSLGDRLAYAEGNNTALLEAATDALDHSEITSRDMEYVMSIHGQAKALLGSARQLMGTDVGSAEGRLLAATKLLAELQNYLRARGVKTSQLEGGFQWKQLSLS
jgi:hypothetical protein